MQLYMPSIKAFFAFSMLYMDSPLLLYCPRPHIQQPRCVPFQPLALIFQSESALPFSTVLYAVLPMLHCPDQLVSIR